MEQMHNEDRLCQETQDEKVPSVREYRRPHVTRVGTLADLRTDRNGNIREYRGWVYDHGGA